MKTNAIVALVLSGLALLSLGGASWYSYESWAKRSSLQRQIDSKKNELKLLENGVAQVKAYPRTDEPFANYSLEDTYTRLAHYVYTMSANERVKVESIRIEPPRTQRTAAQTTIVGMAQSLPKLDKQVQTLKINISGQYRFFQGLIDFIDGLQTFPVILTDGSLDGNRFRLTLHVVGRGSN
ncbi:MAG: hypothetical protein ACK5U5_08660 [Burkholderiales bacterium]|jgi:hypothetical protein